MEYLQTHCVQIENVFATGLSHHPGVVGGGGGEKKGGGGGKKESKKEK